MMVARRLWHPLLIACVLAVTSLRAAEPHESFDEAARLYEQGKYKEAAAAYDALRERGHETAAVLFNQGNAWLKQGQHGRAIAAYRRAQRLEPRDPAIASNLRFARSKVSDGPAAPGGLVMGLLHRFTGSEWALAALGLNWICCALLVIREMIPRTRTVTASLAWLLGALALSITACATAAAIDERKVAAVVVAPTEVRFGPLQEAQSAFTLPDGAEVRVTDFKDDWLHVRDTAGREGWIDRSTALMPTRVAPTPP